MIDFGFVVSAFVPLLLSWMYTFSFPILSCDWESPDGFGEKHLPAVWRLPRTWCDSSSLGLHLAP